MKIAVVTEDGKTISQHFGRAPLYRVFTVENGQVVGDEVRAKASHHTFGEHGHGHGEEGGRHGYDVHSQNRHATMAATIADCQVLLAGGMGRGAYDSLRQYNIEPVVTDMLEIDGAVSAYLAGSLPNLTDRLH